MFVAGAGILARREEGQGERRRRVRRFKRNLETEKTGEVKEATCVNKRRKETSSLLK